VAELHGIEGDAKRGVRIGAMTTLSEICANPMLHDAYPGFVRAVASISSPVLRNMGTIGGNVCLDTRCTYYNQNEEWRRSIDYCMKEQGKICWVATKSVRCWAISASDSAPLLCALGATVRLVSKQGERDIPLTALYHDDGIAYLTMRRDELLTHVVLPPAGKVRSTYWKLRRRGSIDYPVLGVGIAMTLEKKHVHDVQIYLGAVVSAPAAAREASDFLRGKPASIENIAQAASLARRVGTPLDNTDYEIPWRGQMIEAYVGGALRELAGLPLGMRAPAHGQWAVTR
jgi:4-hydroxybenzoyl-CoA reductase subunit beta